MGHLADLLTLAPEALEGLLADETATAWRELKWQYGPVPVPVPGLAWMEGGKPTGYLALGLNGATVSIGRLFASRSGARREMVEKALLDAASQLVFRVPGVRQLLGDLLAIAPSTLEWLQARWPGRTRMRAIMARAAASTPAAGAALGPFTVADLPAAAGILLRAHQHRQDFIPDPMLHHPDGVVMLLRKVVDGEVCGRFQPEASFLARAPGSGALLGFVLATRMGQDQGHIAEIAVDPGASRQGLGSTLMAAATTALDGLGCRGVHLGVDLDNLAAVGFYQRLGFTVCHRFPSLRLTP
jgi:ribosomal protein S18 acetylase RimI-like enzyme